MSDGHKPDTKNVTLRQLMLESTKTIGSFILGGLTLKHMPHFVKYIIGALKTSSQDLVSKAFVFAVGAGLGLAVAVVTEIYHVYPASTTVGTEAFWIGAAGIGLGLGVVTYVGFWGFLFYTGVLLGDLAVVGLLAIYGGLSISYERLCQWFEGWRERKLALDFKPA